MEKSVLHSSKRFFAPLCGAQHGRKAHGCDGARGDAQQSEQTDTSAPTRTTSAPTTVSIRSACVCLLRVYLWGRRTRTGHACVCACVCARVRARSAARRESCVAACTSYIRIRRHARAGSRDTAHGIAICVSYINHCDTHASTRHTHRQVAKHSLSQKAKSLLMLGQPPSTMRWHELAQQ